nr:bifunctional acetate--CoA ligase family protein/GNAT family N-acetyltransferase [uncultured Rhodopila sp.]
MTIPRLAAVARFDPANLFRPASIAVVGLDSEASAKTLANLAVGGFKGEIHTLHSIAQLPQGISLALLALPADQIGEAMTVMAARGCFAAIIPGEADNLREHATRTGVRALGPHSFGLAVPKLGLNATRSHIQPPPGRLALVSQSSAISRAVIDWAEPNGVGFSHIVGVGNNHDIGYGMVLDWLSRDADTGAILLDVRRIKNHRLFLSAARAAAKLRPVVAIRAGLRMMNADGAADLAFEAALRRAGVLCVNRLEDLLAAAETLSRARPVRCDNLAIVSTAIGPGRLARDAVLRAGLDLCDDQTISEHVPAEELAPTAFRLAARPDVGGVLVMHAPSGLRDESIIASLTVKHPEQRAPILFCVLGESTGALHRATLIRAGLPVFATPDQAVRGFEHLVQDRRNRAAARELPPAKVMTVEPDSAWVKRIFARVRAEGRLALTQDESLNVLSAYGVPVVPTRVVSGAADAAAAADLVGYPAVVKMRDTARPGTRPAGGLVLDLLDAPHVATAAQLLAARMPGEQDERALLVQHQAGRAREVAIRVSDGEGFGPTISFGSGGTAPNPHDRAVDLPPLNLPLADALIRRCRSGAMLERALRDRPAGSIDAVAGTLVRVSQLILDFPEIKVFDLPSLFVDQNGVMAADAWVQLRNMDETPPPLAIAPYPQELVASSVIGGESMTIRPIRPEDAEAHAAFFSRLSPQDVRYRFFSAIRELSREQIARLTQVDYDREMAFVAVRDTTGETVGVVRLVCEPNGRSAEFAVIVQADMKGRGLASGLMNRVIAWARTKGLSEVTGQILADNTAMLAFIRHMGFSVRRMPDDPEVMESKLELAVEAGLADRLVPA